jgi:hypothetical protein
MPRINLSTAKPTGSGGKIHSRTAGTTSVAVNGNKNE